jgi:hypothetical protein
VRRELGHRRLADASLGVLGVPSHGVEHSRSPTK